MSKERSHDSKQQSGQQPAAAPPAAPGRALTSASAMGNALFRSAVVEAEPASAINEDGSVTADTQSSIESRRGAGQPLESRLAREMSDHLGDDLSDVRVHTDSTAHSLARSVSAKAFTTGRDVFFAAGEYDPGSDSGRKLIAHELTHTVQQKGAASGGVMRVTAPGGAEEREAEEAAAQTAAPSGGRLAPPGGTTVARTREITPSMDGVTIQRNPAALAAIATKIAKFGEVAGKAASKLSEGGLKAASEAIDQIGTVGGGLRAVGGAIPPATGHSASTINLPNEVISPTDIEKLKQMAQYKIVEAVATSWVEDTRNREIVAWLRDPAGTEQRWRDAAAAEPTPAAPARGRGRGAPATPPPTTPTAPTVTTPTPGTSAEEGEVRAEAIEAAKQNIRTEMAEALTRNTKRTPPSPDWWWSEDNERSADSVGVSGRTYFSQIETTALKQDIRSGINTKLMKVNLTGQGEKTARKIIGGSFSWQVNASRWDSLEISSPGAQAGTVGPEGSASINVPTNWKWDGNTTAQDCLVTVTDTGAPTYEESRSGEPDDNSYLPSGEEEGRHQDWGSYEDRHEPDEPREPRMPTMNANPPRR